MIFPVILYIITLIIILIIKFIKILDGNLPYPDNKHPPDWHRSVSPSGGHAASFFYFLTPSWIYSLKKFYKYKMK